MSEQPTRCRNCPYPLVDDEVRVPAGEALDCPGPTHILRNPQEMTDIQGKRVLRASVGSAALERYCGREDDGPSVAGDEKLIMGPRKKGVRFGIIVLRSIEISEETDEQDLVEDTRNDYEKQSEAPPVAERRELKGVDSPPASGAPGHEVSEPDQLWAEMKAALRDTQILDRAVFARDALETTVSGLINTLGGSIRADDIFALLEETRKGLQDLIAIDAAFRTQLAEYLASIAEPAGVAVVHYPKFIEQISEIPTSHVFGVASNLGEVNVDKQIAFDQLVLIAKHLHDVGEMAEKRAGWMTTISEGSNSTALGKAIDASQECNEITVVVTAVIRGVMNVLEYQW